MRSKNPVTNEWVFRVIDELYEKTGVEPTLNEIREAVGKGSMTKLSEARQIWRKQQEQKVNEIKEQQVREAAPPEVIQQKCGILIADIWEEALNEANQKLIAERKILEQAQSEVKEVIEKANETISNLKNDKAQLNDELNASRTELGKYQAILEVKQREIENLQKELIREREQCERLSQKLEEVTGQHIKRLTELLGNKKEG